MPVTNWELGKNILFLYQEGLKKIHLIDGDFHQKSINYFTKFLGEV